ncbi:alpha/beta fold hydrolase [Rhodobacteraceae bacterium DSL-40]|uniref:alpha/beta hydrolase n=1 Tax=Amaricoccus sp. B4 TaxID=3368557 RepID=UPI000DAB8408
MAIDWDDAFACTPYIPNGARYPMLWAAAANAYRLSRGPERLRANLAYGDHPRQKLDLHLPAERPVGLVVFVHGGYWRRFDRELFSHYATGPVARGWAVAMPGYPFAPEVRISDITRSVTDAIEQVAHVVEGPIVLAGHSAGGHLVTRQICADSRLSPGVLARIGRVVSIAGVHDLRPFLRMNANSDLHLDRAEAVAESPALCEPIAGKEIHVWVGEADRPEFVRQSVLLDTIWSGFDVTLRRMIAPRRHHFDVIDPLLSPTSALSALVTFA